MREVVPEAYELVEDELITAADFRDFTFANVVRLFGKANPRFFEGTRVARAAAEVLQQAPARAAAQYARNLNSGQQTTTTPRLPRMMSRNPAWSRRPPGARARTAYPIIP